MTRLLGERGWALLLLHNTEHLTALPSAKIKAIWGILGIFR